MMIKIADRTITVALDGTIELLAEKSQLASLRQQLTTSLSEYLAVLGIAGTPNITTQHLLSSDRVIQVYVNGLRQPFSPATMRKIWQAEMPATMWNLPKCLSKNNMDDFRQIYLGNIT